jgi:hypothetical protein
VTAYGQLLHRVAAGLATLQIDVPERPPRSPAAELATRVIWAIARKNNCSTTHREEEEEESLQHMGSHHIDQLLSW